MLVQFEFSSLQNPLPLHKERMKTSNLHFSEFHAYFPNSSQNSATLSPQS